MRRACPECRGPVSENRAGDGLACRAHGALAAWLVVDDAGALVAAGRAFVRFRHVAACWVGDAFALEDVAERERRPLFGEPPDWDDDGMAGSEDPRPRARSLANDVK